MKRKICLAGIIIVGAFIYVGCMDKTKKIEKNKDTNKIEEKNNVENLKSNEEEKRMNEKKEKLKGEIEKVVEKELGEIDGEYTFGFKNLSSGITIIKNDNKAVAASVIKIYIMIEAFDKINKGNLRLEDKLRYTLKDKVGGAGNIQEGPVDKEYTIEYLIKEMMQSSDNVATNMLIDYLGIENINNKINEIGLKDTILARKMMDIEAPKEGRENYISPSDIMITFEKLYNGEIISKELDKQMLDIMIENNFKNKMVEKLPKDVQVAHKNGENTGIQNDVGIVLIEGKEYILAITTNKGMEIEQKEAIANISKSIYELVKTT